MEYHPALWLKNRHTSLSGVPSEEQKWCFYTTEALRSYHAPERVNERDRGVMACQSRLYCHTLHSQCDHLCSICLGSLLSCSAQDLLHCCACLCVLTHHLQHHHPDTSKWVSRPTAALQSVIIFCMSVLMCQQLKCTILKACAWQDAGVTSGASQKNLHCKDLQTVLQFLG